MFLFLLLLRGDYGGSGHLPFSLYYAQKNLKSFLAGSQVRRPELHASTYKLVLINCEQS